jgi:hypothetical protein
MASRVLNLVLLLCVGAVFGMIGTVAHQSTFEMLSIGVPWGIAVSLFGIACLLAGIRLVTTDRMPTLLAAIGVLAAIALFSFKSAGGSVRVPDNTLGKVWVVAPVVIAALVVAWPRLRTPGGGRPARRVTGERVN